MTEEDSEDWEAEMKGKSHPKIFAAVQCAEDSTTSSNVYRFPLPLEKIFLIDNARSLRECMRVLCAVRCFSIVVTSQVYLLCHFQVYLC